MNNTSKRPWRVAGSPGIGRGVWIADADEICICEVGNAVEDYRRARLICTAVNHFEKMREIMEVVREAEAMHHLPLYRIRAVLAAIEKEVGDE